jgi:hypothetical protein
MIARKQPDVRRSSHAAANKPPVARVSVNAQGWRSKSDYFQWIYTSTRRNSRLIKATDELVTTVLDLFSK